MLSSQNIKKVMVPSGIVVTLRQPITTCSLLAMMYLTLRDARMQILPSPWLGGAEPLPAAGWLEALLEAFPPASG